jgi:hypothetical protein
MSHIKCKRKRLMYSFFYEYFSLNKQEKKGTHIYIERRRNFEAHSLVIKLKRTEIDVYQGDSFFSYLTDRVCILHTGQSR